MKRYYVLPNGNKIEKIDGADLTVDYYRSLNDMRDLTDFDPNSPPETWTPIQTKLSKMDEFNKMMWLIEKTDELLKSIDATYSPEKVKGLKLNDFIALSMNLIETAGDATGEDTNEDGTVKVPKARKNKEKNSN